MPSAAQESIQRMGALKGGKTAALIFYEISSLICIGRVDPRSFREKNPLES